MELKKQPKILLTGGHALTNAYAVIEEIKSHKPSWKVHWVGTSTQSYFTNLNIKTHFLTTGRIQSKFTRHTIPNLFQIPIGFLQAFILILKIRPKLTLSFGGFAAFPVVFWSKIFRVPIIVHEQSSTVGLANKVSMSFAKTIAVARRNSLSHFPKSKTILTGNPIRKSILLIKPKNKLSNPPALFITGGSRGAQNINREVIKALPKLTKKYKIIHQTGELDFNKFNKLSLPNYQCYSTLHPDKMSKIIKKSDILIGRAGANTVAEISLTRRPAILIPIPWARNNEQLKNAKLASDAGIAIILPQRKLKPRTLLKSIQKIIKNYNKIISFPNPDYVNKDKKAAGTLVNLIEKNLK